MKIALDEDYSVWIVDDSNVYNVNEVIDDRWKNSKYVTNHLIEDYDRYKPLLEEFLATAQPSSHPVEFSSPSPTPINLIAAPLNYRKHISEMSDSKYVGDAYVPKPPSELGFFLKSVSSICGAKDVIELPNMPGREFHFEGELAVIIGKEARNVSKEDAVDHIFGYSCLLDITLRNTPEITNERSMRKSFETFTPIGPFIVTRDEVGADNDLDLRLDVNGETRQHANTRDLLTNVAELIQLASSVMTLYPGDVIATGTPEGVGQLHHGDTLNLSISRVADFEMRVAELVNA